MTPYLAEETVLTTLQWIAGSSSQNGVAFDYVVPRASVNFLHRMAFDGLAARVAAAGEPFVGFFDPDKLARKLVCEGEEILLIAIFVARILRQDKTGRAVY